MSLHPNILVLMLPKANLLSVFAQVFNNLHLDYDFNTSVVEDFQPVLIVIYQQVAINESSIIELDC